MAESEWFIGRREFLTGAAATAAATVAYLSYTRRYPYVSPFPERTVSPRELMLPSELVGLHINCPFLWQLADNPFFLQRALASAKQIGAKSARVFISDKFEPGLGVYDLSVLDKIKELSSHIQLQIDLFDAFPLLRADKYNPVYSRAKLTSPYLVPQENTSKLKMQQAFFTDPILRNHFVNRILTIVKYFQDEPNIISWSVTNELSPPPGIPHKKGRELLNGWYEQMISAIRTVDRRRTIVSGVADPTFLNESRLKTVGLDANTVHLYGKPLPKYKQYLPLWVQEIGFPRRIFGISLSDDRYDASLFYSLSGILPRLTGLAPWRLSFPGDPHQDGFEIIPENLPKTTHLLQQWSNSMI